MNEMVDRVLMLCPECDRDEVEKDLHLTGNIEMTINHALDGMLTARQIASWSSADNETSKNNLITVMDDDDDVITTLPWTSKFTAIKEKAPPKQLNESITSINGEITNLDNDKLKSEITKDIVEMNRSLKTSTFHEISDSDSENDMPQALGEKYQKSRTSSKMSDSISPSKKSEGNIELFRVPRPGSNSEFFPPAFDHGCETYTKTAVKKIDNGVSVLEKHALSPHSEHSVRPSFSAQEVLTVEGNCTNDESYSSEEPVKTKKTSKVEIEKQKKATLLKKQSKEKERQERLDERKRQKDARAAEQQQRKLKMEREKLQKQAEKLTKSATRLDGCTKFITACLEPSLLPDGSSGPVESLILQKLISMGANYKIEPQPYPGSITWQRTSVQHSVLEDELKLTESTTCCEENEALVVVAAKLFVEMVFSFKQDYQARSENHQKEKKTPLDFTQDVKRCFGGKKITFLLNGLEKYMRNLKTKQQRTFRNAALGTTQETAGNRKKRKKQTTPTVDVTRTDIEEALVDLQMKTGVCVYPCETEEDIAMKVASFTKAVAEKPYKKSISEGLGFCMEKVDKASLKVSKDGQGLVKVWQQQLEQLRNVSREMAAAIVAVFPSPQLLLEAYKQCNTEREAMRLLEDILVRRGGGSLATSRRIGPELSKRFYHLFHSRDSGELMK